MAVLLAKAAPGAILGHLVFNGAASSPVYDNRPKSQDIGVPATLWELVWFAQASVTSLTIVIEGAPDSHGSPGAFATLATASTFPNGKLKYETTTGYFPWMRVSVTAVGGAGVIVAVLSGFQENAESISGGGGGGGGGGTSDPDETPFVVGTTEGTPIMGVVNPVDTPADGDLVVVATDNQRRLKVSGSFTATPVTSDTISAGGPLTIGASSTLALAANPARIKLGLQNVGTTQLFILLGAGTASASNYHFALPMGGVANDGSSPIYIDVIWQGAVTVISSAAGGKLQAWEMT